MHPPNMGAITPLYAATCRGLKTADGGSYFIPWAQHGIPLKGTQDVELAIKLWGFLEKDVERYVTERAI